ncbi:MAG: hypothetical protein Fues2KO_42410 [Fuerstiella sp.]
MVLVRKELGRTISLLMSGTPQQSSSLLAQPTRSTSRFFDAQESIGNRVHSWRSSTEMVGTHDMKRTLHKIQQRCVTSCLEPLRAWRRFWFEPADPFTLGLIRVLTGLMLTYNLLVWGLDFDAFFATEGLQPLQPIRKLYDGTAVFSFWLYVPSDWIATVHWICVAFAVLFCLGAATRLTSVAAFVITISYSQRVPVANFGLDQILGMLCLYLAIGPSGAAVSLDEWWRQGRTGKNRSTSRKHVSARIALRLMQLHVCIIYFWAGFAKLKGDSWWTGEAMWRVIANEEYQTIDLTWMAQLPWLPYLIAHVTVAWEVFFCVLVWNRYLRPFMLAMGTMMHVGIGAFLGMWTFGLVMTFPYLAFSDPKRWRNRLNAVRRRPSEPNSATVESRASENASNTELEAAAAEA